MNVWLYDLLNTMLPLNCQVCGKLLSRSEQVICIACEWNLPRTEFTDDPDNPVSQLFWGRTRVLQATSLFKFEKGSAYQVLMHNLKYRGEKRNGYYLGRLLGSAMEKTIYTCTDIIVPVPLHRRKRRKRGYNQSGLIAEGVASIIRKPVIHDFLIRTASTETQTRKNRYERFRNMESMFRLHPDYTSLPIFSCLLIDDVVTTGATLEACSEAILKEKEIEIYAATVAVA